jgi:hypothetical protein
LIDTHGALLQNALGTWCVLTVLVVCGRDVTSP